MPQHVHPDPTVIVIFGAGGDLAMRKLLPALFNLYLDHWLPEKFAIVGVDRKAMSDDEFRKHLRAGVDQFSRRGKTADKEWAAFAEHLNFHAADFGSAHAAAFTALAGKAALSTRAGAQPPTTFSDPPLDSAKSDRPHRRAAFQGEIGPGSHSCPHRR